VTRWLARTLAVSNGVLASLALIVALGCSAVTIRYLVEYVVNNNRDTSHWVEYFEVSPVAESFPVGSQPVFYSRATWHTEVLAGWQDVMWCEETEGPYKGRQRRMEATGFDRRELRRTGLVGHYDENGKRVAGSFAGYWEWQGPVPAHPATCWLDPRPVLYPSPLVGRSVPVPPTSIFEFR